MTRIALHGDEYVHMEPRRLDGSEPIDLSLLPLAIIGAHVEDTVSCGLDGEVLVHRVSWLPASFSNVRVTFAVDAPAGAASGADPSTREGSSKASESERGMGGEAEGREP